MDEIRESGRHASVRHLYPSVGIQQPWAEDSHLWVNCHGMQHSVDAPGGHESVAVQEHQIIAAGKSQRPVIGLWKAEITLVLDELDTGKLRYDRLATSIRGAIIHNEYLKATLWWAA